MLIPNRLSGCGKGYRNIEIINAGRQDMSTYWTIMKGKGLYDDNVIIHGWLPL